MDVASLQISPRWEQRFPVQKWLNTKLPGNLYLVTSTCRPLLRFSPPQVEAPTEIKQYIRRRSFLLHTCVFECSPCCYWRGKQVWQDIDSCITWVVKICSEPSAFKFHPGLLSISTIISDAMWVNFWLIFNYHWFLSVCFIFNSLSLPDTQGSWRMTFLCLKCWLLLSMKESAFSPKPFIPDFLRTQVLNRQ